MANTFSQKGCQIPITLFSKSNASYSKELSQSRWVRVFASAPPPHPGQIWVSLKSENLVISSPREKSQKHAKLYTDECTKSWSMTFMSHAETREAEHVLPVALKLTEHVDLQDRPALTSWQKMHNRTPSLGFRPIHSHRRTLDTASLGS